MPVRQKIKEIGKIRKKKKKGPGKRSREYDGRAQMMRLRRGLDTIA
jgi:hypothetical protein